MRKPGGYLRMTGPASTLTGFSDPGEASFHRHGEVDTYTCGHCQHVTCVPPQQDAADFGGWCRVCERLVCAHCAAAGRCSPWERQFEMAERRQALRSII